VDKTDAIDSILQQRHSLRKIISGLEMEHPSAGVQAGEGRGVQSSQEGVKWSDYHDRHRTSQAQGNQEELWFMPEHVESPTGTHLRTLYSAQLTAHEVKDSTQQQRTAERRAQQLLRRMRFLISQQRLTDAQGLQLAFDAAASVALPGLRETHEVRQQFMRSRAVQQEAFASSDGSGTGSGMQPAAVLPATQLGAYVPPPMTAAYARDYALNDISPGFAEQWNAHRAKRIAERLQHLRDFRAVFAQWIHQQNAGRINDFHKFIPPPEIWSILAERGRIRNTRPPGGKRLSFPHR
jgi:hypothetical protein